MSGGKTRLKTGRGRPPVRTVILTTNPMTHVMSKYIGNNNSQRRNAGILFQSSSAFILIYRFS